jgi:hypothetical protein
MSPATMHLPPAAWSAPASAHVVFLAGSIEMGTATDWQSELVAALPENVVALNPRRAEWDSSWRQSIEEPNFREQVEWELDGLDRASTIAMWFAPETRAPITLLELGLHARSGKLVIGCPEGFWRRGNIEVVAAKHAIPLFADWAEFVMAVIGRT